MTPAAIRKTITAVVIGVVGWATLVVNSAPTDISASEWIVLATALATAAGVFGVPNDNTNHPA